MNRQALDDRIEDLKTRLRYVQPAPDEMQEELEELLTYRAAFEPERPRIMLGPGLVATHIKRVTEGLGIEYGDEHCRECAE